LKHSPSADYPLDNMVKIDGEKMEKLLGETRTEEQGFILMESVRFILEEFGHAVDSAVFQKRSVSFFSGGRETLTVNLSRDGLRVYIHPASGALLEPGMKPDVEKFNFWKSSFQKKTGKYRGMTLWVSERGHLPGLLGVLKEIPVGRSRS
jgi:hypothetical protein